MPWRDAFRRRCGNHGLFHGPRRGRRGNGLSRGGLDFFYRSRKRRPGHRWLQMLRVLFMRRRCRLFRLGRSWRLLRGHGFGGLRRDCSRCAVSAGASKVRPHLIGHIVIERTGVRFLFRDADLRKAIQDCPAFHFQFACQLIDSDTAHFTSLKNPCRRFPAKYFNSSDHRAVSSPD